MHMFIFGSFSSAPTNFQFHSKLMDKLAPLGKNKEDKTFKHYLLSRYVNHCYKRDFSPQICSFVNFYIVLLIAYSTIWWHLA